MVNTILKFLFYAALLGAVVTLIIGVCNMFFEKLDHNQISNRLMRFRVLFQGAALMILAVLLFKGR